MLKSTHRPAAAPSSPAPPLPPGWTEHIAPSGHPYYYNAETKQSTYTRPALQPQANHLATSTSAYPVISAPGTATQSYYPTEPPPGKLFPRHGQSDSRGYHSHQYRRRAPPNDRPKHKFPLPDCAPWVLVTTRLGRRFVHNLDTRESFWKFPEHVLKAVVEFDRRERERKEVGQEATERQPTDTAAEDNHHAPAIDAAQDDDQESVVVEYEEVEASEEEDEEVPSKKARTSGEDMPLEYNEDDIAYQLAAMEQGHELVESGSTYEQDEAWNGEGDAPPLAEEDTHALFRDLLEDCRISPYSPWESVVEEGRIIDDPRYTVLPNMKARKSVFSIWSKEKIAALKEERKKMEERDPRIPYMAFLQRNATPKLYWPEFRRKFKKEPEMQDRKLSDKDREKIYREHISRLKMPQSALKADLTALLKSLPLSVLNRSTTLDSLPTELLTDLRYVSLPATTRDPMIEAYITTLGPKPEATGISSDETHEQMRQKADRERRERALAQRERWVEQERKRQEREQAIGKVRLRGEEKELEKAMQVGKAGLLGQLEVEQDKANCGHS